MSELIDRSARVSSLELFFDLVFVFTITQLTGVLVTGDGAASALQVIVMLAVIWWMYDGYAWLTNAIATDLLRLRLLLGGMGGFLVIALAIPTAYQGQGLAFGIGYVVVVVLHAGMYSKSTSVSEVAAILRIVPYNLTSAALVLLGGIVGGRAQDVIWIVAAVVLWATGWFANTKVSSSPPSISSSVTGSSSSSRSANRSWSSASQQRASRSISASSSWHFCHSP